MRARGLVLLLACSGCSASRFASVSSGQYDCTATVTSNTCGVVLSPSPEVVDVTSGDPLSVRLPSSSTLLAAPDVPWGTAQFGAQANPLTYYGSGSQACGRSTMATVSDAEITELGDDALHIEATHRYTSAASCAPVDTCELVFAVHCARR